MNSSQSSGKTQSARCDASANFEQTIRKLPLAPNWGSEIAALDEYRESFRNQSVQYFACPVERVVLQDEHIVEEIEVMPNKRFEPMIPWSFPTQQTPTRFSGDVLCVGLGAVPAARSETLPAAT